MIAHLLKNANAHTLWKRRERGLWIVWIKPGNLLKKREIHAFRKKRYPLAGILQMGWPAVDICG